MSDADIHIVDDFSESGQRSVNKSICHEYGANYHLNDRNRGPAFSRNVGTKAAEGDWVAFLDDDVSVDKNWFLNVKEALLSADRQVLGVEGVTKALGKGLWDSEVENTKGGLYLSCNSIYRKKTLLRLGGFDESFSGPFAEDQELALRVKKWGNITFEKGIIVYHMARQINFLHYFIGSFSRMRSLLDAEYHFYIKHRDRYHTCRYASTFWEGLVHILLKHCLITLRRRKILKLLLHPVQTSVLIVSSLYEQIAAWLLSIAYLKRYIFERPDCHFANIDNKATAALWKFKKDKFSSILIFRAGIIRSLLFRINQKPVYNALTILKKTRSITRSKDPCVFFRIDDLFLRDDEIIGQFCDIMEEVNIPFLAGITGQDFINRAYSRVIQRIYNIGGAIGIHGFYHTGRYGPYSSEILQLTFPELDTLTNQIIKEQEYKGIKPIAFIPPFNAISWEQIVHLSNRFPVICGGPETARFTNCSFGPVVLATGGIYFPSFYPFYDCCSNMLNSEFIRNIVKSKSPICITTHLYNEAEDNFRSLSKLVNVLKSAITDWSDLCIGNDCLPNKIKDISG